MEDIKNNILYTIISLAHQNNKKVSEFLEVLTQTYSVILENLPKDDRGDTVNPDGTVNMELDFTDDEVIRCGLLAEQKDVTLNKFFNDAVSAAIEKDSFKIDKDAIHTTGYYQTVGEMEPYND